MSSKPILVTVGLLGLGSFASHCQDKRSGPESWVAAYLKLGGQAGLTASPRDEPTLWVQKRMGQKPLVGLKGLPAPGVRIVGLQGYEVNDDDLEALADWKDLEELQIVDGKVIGDKGVKALARLPALRRLELIDTSVTGTGVAAFSGHATLTHLTLSNTTLATRVRTLELKDLPKLEQITLSAEGVTGVRLANLPRLRYVGDFPLDLKTADLSDLGDVTELVFRRSKLNKLSLSRLPKLDCLDVRDTELDDKAVADLKRANPKVNVRR